jgi:hypothetical protein
MAGAESKGEAWVLIEPQEQRVGFRGGVGWGTKTATRVLRTSVVMA